MQQTNVTVYTAVIFFVQILRWNEFVLQLLDTVPQKFVEICRARDPNERTFAKELRMDSNGMDSNNLKSKVGQLMCPTCDLRLLESIYIHKLSPNLNNHNSPCPLNILMPLFALFFFLIVEYYLNRKRKKKTITSCIMFKNLTYLFFNEFQISNETVMENIIMMSLFWYSSSRVQAFSMPGSLTDEQISPANCLVIEFEWQRRRIIAFRTSTGQNRWTS